MGNSSRRLLDLFAIGSFEDRPGPKARIKGKLIDVFCPGYSVELFNVDLQIIVTDR
jgi:hypothetical protein